jgi:hypothetical protein
MINDYLWDRTGSDADIERLESLLGGMKFQPDGPPAREIVIEPARPRWFMRLGLGFAAASMATAALLFAIFPGGDTPYAVVVEQEQRPTETKLTAKSQPDVEYAKASATPQRPKKRVPKKRIRREARSAPMPEPQRPLPETFTAEERDAYRQLMTALAITGEKLSIVRDKLNGTEED